MPLDILRHPAAASRWATPTELRLAALFCLILLTSSCALASFVFACATPFAAFAVVAAAMLPLRSALLVMIVAWIANQAIGFGALGYPHDLHTMLWGFAIGAAALLSTVESKVLLLHPFPGSSGPAALALALFGAYAAYEVVLFAFTPLLGGAGTFTLPIIAHLGLLNLLWLIGLVAVCAVFSLLSAISRRQSRRNHTPLD
jgi:hypothetical protein